MERMVHPAGQRSTPYADALLAHRERARHRFMIPGHAINQYGGGSRLETVLGARALSLDIPQMIDGIDIGTDHAFGRALELAAEAWDARSTWFLTNGASQGNRMALMALRALGERVLVQRSAHSSVYDGLVMAGLDPVYVLPQIDRVHEVAHVVSAAEIERALAAAEREARPIAGVVVVSPSYFGVVADVPAIAEACHRHGAALVVDGSWGAHFGFHPELPESPTRLGADIVVTSVHKLGGSLTQTAAIHLVDGAFADELQAPLDTAYRLTESTSLNALLLASLDIARSELATGGERIRRAIDAAAELRSLIDQEPGFRTLDAEFSSATGAVAVDPLHVAIDVRATGSTGMRLKHELGAGPSATFLEIATPTALVALIGALSNPDPRALVEALRETAARAGTARSESADRSRLVEDAAAAGSGPPAPGELVLTPRQAYLSRHETVGFELAVGRVAAEMLAAYPPGIPNVVPGEVITADAVEYLRAVAVSPGGHVRGAVDAHLDAFRVCLPE